MKGMPLRFVLAIYSAGEGDPEAALKDLHSAGSKTAFLFGGGDAESKIGKRPIARYSHLRLDGETILAVEAQPPEVEVVVQRLQNSGSPAIFVLHEEIASGSATRPEPPSMFARLEENEHALDLARRDLAEAVRMGHALTAAAEWILDNAYLIRTQIAEIRRNLPQNYSRNLAALEPGYDLAKELVVRSDQSLNENNITEWLRQSQAAKPLTIAELWFFPLLLRMALIDSLRELASRVRRAQQLREAAYLWANRLAAGARRGPETFAQIVSRMESESFALEPYFVASLLEQLHDEEDALAPLQGWVEGRLKTPITELVRNEHTREASERLLTANAFGSLRALPRIDFTRIFDAVSLVEAELRTDSAYALSDFTTRDQCRRAVERISRHSGVSELDVARSAVRLAAQAADAQARHTAYYLLAGGVTQLEAVTKARVRLKTRFIRALRRQATGTYLTSVTLLAAAFLAVAIILASEGGVRSPVMLAVLGVLALFPLGELAIQIVNALVISLLPPDPLPKMDFKDGIPEESATLVAVPMMLSNLRVVAEEVEKLEVRFLANRENNLFFSLFSDFTDSPEPTAPNDGELLQAARNGIAELNSRYPGERFLLFHRERIWSESEGMWIGRERKRGKIEDLNEFLVRQRLG